MPLEDLYELVVDGIKCPPDITHILTPMEFEELVISFYSYNPSRSGLVRRDEFKAICIELNTPGNVDELIKTLDVNDEGLLSFEDLCRITVMVKTSVKGRVRVITEELAREKTTPFVELHKQAAARDLIVKFIAVDIRDSCDVGVPVHVTEVR
jgi:hypothetical protein